MSNAEIWTPPPRPEWLQAMIDETQYMDIRDIVPLDPENLIATAVARTGLSDFGPDDWREGFEVMTRSLEEESDLHIFGRIMTRNELLNQLTARLEIEETYRRNPQIDDEVIDSPVIITGLGRSGTSILFEILSQDSQFGSPSSWEGMFPCPPPEAATYRTDPRADKADHLLKQWGRAAPAWRTMHEGGGWIPAECVAVYEPTFRGDNMPSKIPMASYSRWLMASDMTPALEYYRRILKLLQWKNPRRHWLLKAPSHMAYLPTLFKVFPDARLVVTHRDPVRANASITNMLATLYWMRSHKPFNITEFESLMAPEGIAARLNNLMDDIEAGNIPGDQVFASLYHDLVTDPEAAIRGLYQRTGMELTPEALAAMQAYLAHKPKGKFGVHRYKIGEKEEIARQRRLYQRYQEHFHVPNEV